MPANTDPFPAADNLWRGCILASVMHAVAMTTFPELAYEHSWDGPNYSVNDSAGTRGTITFADSGFVALFRDERSSELHELSGDAVECPLFHGAPRTIVELAREETLQYLLDDVSGTMAPCISAAFWGCREETAATAPWQGVFRQGAHVIGNQCKPLEEQFSLWSQLYSIDDPLVSVARHLFDRRVAGSSLEVGKDHLKIVHGYCTSAEAWQET